MSEEKNVQNERSTQEHEEAFLKRVEQAAARGAKKGGKSGAWLQILPSLIVIGLIAGLILPKINAMHQGFQSLTTFSEKPNRMILCWRTTASSAIPPQTLKRQFSAIPKSSRSSKSSRKKYPMR